MTKLLLAYNFRKMFFISQNFFHDIKESLHVNANLRENHS